MGMNGVSRRPRGGPALWIVALLALATVGHTLLWRWAEQRLRSGFDVWVAERRGEGWRVRSAEPVAAGWPLAAQLVVKQVSVEGVQADIPDGFAWSAERVTLAVALLQPRLLAILPHGEQHLRLSRLPDIPYTADRLRIAIPLEPGGRAQVADLSANTLRAGIPGGGAARALTVGLLSGHVEHRSNALGGEAALTVQASAEAIALPPGLPWALGGRISSTSIEGALSGPVPPAPTFVQRAAAWRDGGGTLEVQRFALGWGPLGVTGSATLALDARLQPMGTGNTRMVGYAEALDELAGSGAITSRTALAVKAVAGLIAASPETGGPPQLEVPLTLQDRTLSIRQIPVARMPALTWPP